MNLKVITKDGELSARFFKDHKNIAIQYAEMHNGKVIDIESNTIIYDACKKKHFRRENVNQK